MHTLTQDVVAEIRHDRYHHPHPRVRQKMDVLWHRSREYTHEEIAYITALSLHTVQRYLAEFAAGGLDQVRRIPWLGRSSELAEHLESLEEYFLEHQPATAREAQTVIKTRTGIQLGLTQVRAFLKKSWLEVAEGRNDARQGRSRGPESVSEHRAPAAS